MKGIKNYCGIVLLMMLFFFTACSVSKEARTMKNTINGYWILQTIRIEGTDLTKVNRDKFEIAV